ncbi:ferritin-like domain-containing protein [Bacillus norwichensis]|uniref:Ferritin-like domain-containing protein n=1 Tax=Bacillus norwichensis TaxID=2762217 RepID=A0ABR8VPT4_9BACI|nr:ferritin-like domain-containing protein [Bacillus norwichensis]MBD8006774.1 ferritin-like domain-containing protein [Bacillus norwichensis]
MAFMDFTIDQKLERDIVNAINGEYSAIACYGQLIEMAPSEREKKIIREIRNDEIRHFHYISAIYMLMMNRQPDPKITKKCPNNFTDGLKFAFEDEQETVDFYHEIADKAKHPYIQHLFRRAAADEQNHAVWFLSMMK